MAGRGFEISVDPTIDENDSIKAAVHIVTDVTDRIIAEERLRSIFRAMPKGMAITRDHLMS
jgi:hypothetical protein